MVCTQCGTKLDDSARYGTACGHPTGPVLDGGMSAAVYPEPRRLRRLMSEKKIAGVCAGFAEYFDVDVTLMRIIWLALLLCPPGIGLIAYIVAIFVLPKSYEPRIVQP